MNHAHRDQKRRRQFERVISGEAVRDRQFGMQDRSLEYKPPKGLHISPLPSVLPAIEQLVEPAHVSPTPLDVAKFVMQRIVPDVAPPATQL